MGDWQSVGHLIEDAARQYAERPLFIFEGETRTYAHVDQAVNRWANVLRERAIAKGDRVAVMLPNGFDFPTAWLAIAKCGAILVPINTGYQERDLAYVLTDSGACAVIAHADFCQILHKVRGSLPNLHHLLILGTDADTIPEWMTALAPLIERASDQFAIENVSAADLLNIQYTSGTTGFPKGCMLTHGYWLEMGRIVTSVFHLRPDDVDLTAQPFYYMDAQWNTITCLMGGIPLVIMARFSPSKFWPLVAAHGVTFFYVLGTMPIYLLKQPINPELEQNHRLRIVFCSGIVPDLHATYEQRWAVPWREAFGMTETGVDLYVPLEAVESVGTGWMGIPVASKQVCVVDANDQPLPDGETGELVVKGTPMMRGYWNQPEKTAEAIRDGWLHTGDLAVREPSGYFRLVGRLKDMIRRTGENIAAAEVEGVLVEHPQIAAAAIVPVPDELRGEEVKAYIQLRPGAVPTDVTPEAIIAFAAHKLAKFKLPRFIEYVTTFPLTPSERIAKHELIRAKTDLRSGSFDMVEGLWIP